VFVLKLLHYLELKTTPFSENKIPKGPPPIPKITNVKSKTSSAEIIFECDDYATEEYKAQYEIESFPSSIVCKNIKSSPCIFPNLNNGWKYFFSMSCI